MAGDKVEFRKQAFKSRGLTGDESRRRREEASVEIRKVKREESLNKKRMGAMDGRGLGASDANFAIVDEDDNNDNDYVEDDFGMSERDSDVIKYIFFF